MSAMLVRGFSTHRRVAATRGRRLRRFAKGLMRQVGGVVGTRVQKRMPLKRLDTLVVEDDDYMARTFVGMLNALGISKVRSATSVKDALLAIRTRPPDFVLLDAGLQGMPAHQVVAELESLDIPFVVVTGYPREMLPMAFLTPPLLRKPITMGDLEKSVRTLIRRSS